MKPELAIVWVGVALIIAILLLAWAIYVRAGHSLEYIAAIEKIVVATAAIIVPFLVAYYGGQITKTLGFKNHDFLILQHFHKIFPEPNNRRLAVHLLGLLVDKEIEFQTRAAVFWDILDENINKAESFSFNAATPDWHYLGENITRMFSIENKEEEAKRAFVKFRDDAKKTFHSGSKKKEIDELFEWLESTYLTPVTPSHKDW